MYLLSVFSPLLNFLIIVLFGRKIGKQGSSFLSIFLLLTCLISSYLIFYEITLSRSTCSFLFTEWVESELFFVNWGFLFDDLSSTMLIVVSTVSSLVHFYSIDYMSEDPHFQRFMSYLSLFTFFMLILITSNNFIQMFLGWEGVGLASYLLINFWYTRILANKAAMKAMIVNRIGDFGLTIGIILSFLFFKSLDFPVIFSLLNEFYYKINFLDPIILQNITLFIFIGAIGKSAQIGLHTWLPDAMEGPTPVSALIHAATMVTAGVFILLRCNPLLEYCNNVLFWITIMGSLTAIIAASIGIVQNDLKKVIAYSTCSQLGYMVFSCGLSNYSVSLFHLTNHAFFKALLFLSAGSIIHAMNDEQDMRKMGGLIKLIPISYIMILVGSLALMGFPFLTGFYSKDIVLELAINKITFSSIISYWLGLIAAFCTSFYSFRLIFLTFFKKTKFNVIELKNIHESSNFILIPLFILCIGSIFFGFLGRELFLGLGSNFFCSSAIQTIDSEFSLFYIKIIPLIFSFLGTLSAVYIYVYFIDFTKLSFFINVYNSYLFLVKKWLFDFIYNNFFVKELLKLGYIIFKNIDRGFLELLGPLGIVRSFSIISKNVSSLQTGYIYHYLLLMVISLTFFLLTMNLLIKYIFIILFLYSFLNFNIRYDVWSN